MRIPSWLEADPALHREAVYIEADRFFHQKILLAIGRRTIHNPDPVTSVIVTLLLVLVALMSSLLPDL